MNYPAVPQLSEIPYQTEVYRRGVRFTNDPYNGLLVGAGSLILPSPPVMQCFANGAAASYAESRNVYGGAVAAARFFRSGGVDGHWNMPWIVQAFMKSHVRDAAAGSYYGIQLGSFNVGIPFPAPSGTQNVIQLRVNEDPANYRFELLVNDSTGAGAQVIIPDIAARVPAVGVVYHAMIEYKPSEYVRAFIDGVLVGESTATLPELVGTGVYGLGTFAACNTAAGTESAYFACQAEQSFYRV